MVRALGDATWQKYAWPTGRTASWSLLSLYKTITTQWRKCDENHGRTEDWFSSMEVERTCDTHHALYSTNSARLAWHAFIEGGSIGNGLYVVCTWRSIHSVLVSYPMPPLGYHRDLMSLMSEGRSEVQGRQGLDTDLRPCRRPTEQHPHSANSTGFPPIAPHQSQSARDT